MADYLINIILGLAGLAVVLLMNLVIIKKFYSHRDQFTGLLSKFYKNLSEFFVGLLCVQLIFPLYIIQLNVLRADLMQFDSNIIFFERMYLALFVIISIALFYVAAKLIDNMDKLAGAYSFSSKKLPSLKKPAPKKMSLHNLYFTPEENKKK
ncbi:MAG: hypothetical protein AABX14_00950 [Candidatus Aenigmatarchaeota archaeon]